MLTLVSFNAERNAYVLMNQLTGDYATFTREMLCLLCENAQSGRFIRNLNLYRIDEGGYSISVDAGIFEDARVPYGTEFIPDNFEKPWFIGQKRLKLAGIDPMWGNERSMFRATDPEHSGFALSHIREIEAGKTAQNILTFEPVDKSMRGGSWSYSELDCTVEDYAAYTLETQHIYCDYDLFEDAAYKSGSFGEMIAKSSIHFAVPEGFCGIVTVAVCGLLYACDSGAIKSTDSGIVWKSSDDLSAVEMVQTDIEGCVDFILHTAYRSFYLAKGLLFNEFFRVVSGANVNNISSELPAGLKTKSLGTAVFQDLVHNVGHIYTQFCQNTVMHEWLKGSVVGRDD